jgi:hypothetical protein
MIAKTTAERVQALRQHRKEAGLKRLELYAHPDDHAALKALAERLQRKRLKAGVIVNPFTGQGSMAEAWKRGYDGRPMLAAQGSDYARAYNDGKRARTMSHQP